MHYKLTPLQVDEIRDKEANGIPKRRLAFFYRVDYNTIVRICSRRLWKPKTMLRVEEWKGILPQ
jgi:hypothetical protein